MREYNLAIVIGRFQPFHNGHMSVLIKAMSKADEVLVLVGSANKAPNIKDPFTFKERKQMIINSILDTELSLDGGSKAQQALASKPKG